MKSGLLSLLIVLLNVFVGDGSTFAQNIYTYAGNGTPGYSGDGGPALLAQLEAPTGVVTDAAGNLYFCEWYYGLIRKIDPSGIITTIAGGLTTNLSDGIPAVNAFVKHPWGITLDTAGNIYFTERQYNQVRKISTSGIITTVAGVASMTGGFAGDGGLATAASLNGPADVAIDTGGNIYITDAVNHRIRKVNSLGIISTIAGSSAGFSGDGGPAINAKLYNPTGICVDVNKNIYISDMLNHRIRKIDSLGIINTIVGTGVFANSGDNGPAISAEIGQPYGILSDGYGNLIFADISYGTIRKVDATGIITKIAGIGIGGGYSGDGGAAISAQFYSPIDVTFDKLGSFYISDNGNQRIRKVCSNSPLTVLSSMSVTCASELATLSVIGAGSYTWSTGSTSATIIVSPSVTTTYTVNQADMVGCSNSGVITQIVNGCVGVHEYFINDIKIYPNPATNAVHISDENNAFENSTVEVTNYLGQTVLKQAYSNFVDVSKLPTGLYTLKITDSDKVGFYSKFIKH